MAARVARVAGEKEVAEAHQAVVITEVAASLEDAMVAVEVQMVGLAAAVGEAKAPVGH